MPTNPPPEYRRWVLIAVEKDPAMADTLPGKMIDRAASCLRVMGLKLLAARIIPQKASPTQQANAAAAGRPTSKSRLGGSGDRRH